MSIKLKTGVNPDVTFEFAVLLGFVAAQWQARGFGDFVVTSLKDGTHKADSQHKQDKPKSVLGEAGDVRTWMFWIWKDDATKNHYLKHGKLPEEMKWKDAGKHQPRMVEFARSLQPTCRVVLHPDWDGDDDSVPPHLHIGKKITFVEKDTA